jgi:hypothetical protein
MLHIVSFRLIIKQFIEKIIAKITKSELKMRILSCEMIDLSIGNQSFKMPVGADCVRGNILLESLSSSEFI